MLIKYRDEAAVPGNVGSPSSDDRSVASGRTMEEIAAGEGRRAKPFLTVSGAGAGAIWQSNRDGGPAAAGSDPVTVFRKSPKPAAKSRMVGSLPAFIEPQLATSVAKPPSGTRWAHEIKFDGYRM